jgi:membrane protein DedA with SNARE-associated domain
MNGIETFLNDYGLPAIAAVLLIKSIGVPIPIPADVLMFAAVARVASGADGLGLAFTVLLIAIIVGDGIQFWLARGPGRATVYRVGRYLGLTPERLDAASALVRKSGPIGLAVIMLTPGVRAASVVACGLANVSLRVFVFGLVIGEGLFLALHFFLGSILGVVWQTLTQNVPRPLVIAIFIGLLLVGFGAWILIRRHQRPAAPRREIVGSAFEAFHEASCPVCLALGSIDRLNPAANVNRHSHGRPTME